MKDINLYKHLAPIETFLLVLHQTVVYQKLIKIFSLGAGRDVVELNNLLHRNMVSRNLTNYLKYKNKNQPVIFPPVTRVKGSC